MSKQGRVVFGAMEEVVFGRPAADAIVEQADRLFSGRVFLMVSHTLNTKTDEIEKIRKALGARCAGTFDAMPPHTPRAAVIAAAQQVKAAGADLIVTVGGGSIIDAAKAVQLCLANNITSPEAMDALRVVGGVVPPIKPPAVRQISVPTALSAGEFSNLSGVTDERTKTKELFRHPLVMPRAVIIDPAITRHTPEWLWTSTGIRAVDHCVEGLCSLESHPYGDAQAIQGLALLAQALPRVQANPADMAARLDCQLGAWLSMGALSAGVPMGASHGIGYILGAAHGVPHGHTSCIMLPAVMRWNKPANAAKQALVATAMGHAGMDAGDALDRFIAGLGQPRRLSDVKIGPEHFDAIAKASLATPWVPRNPRKIDGAAHVREILELAA
jgi:maleylacetate reductase